MDLTGRPFYVFLGENNYVVATYYEQITKFLSVSFVYSAYFLVSIVVRELSGFWRQAAIVDG